MTVNVAVVVPVSPSPTATSPPEIDGSAPASTAAVGAELTVAEPSSFEPVTATRMVEPTSPAFGTYVVAVAPGTGEQLSPAASQTSHWKAVATGANPENTPGEAVRVRPTWAVPEIEGGVVFAAGW